MKTVESVFNEQTWGYENTTKLYVRSSVLNGMVISEMDEQGHKLNTYVYAGGGVLARQFKGVAPYSNDYVSFEHRDASGASLRTTYTDGQVLTQEEYDPLGADANLGPTLTNVPPPDEGGSSLLDYGQGGLPSFLRVIYAVDHIPVTRETFMSFAEMAFPEGLGFAMLFQDARNSRNDANYFWKKDTSPLGRENGWWIPSSIPINPSLSSLFGGFLTDKAHAEPGDNTPQTAKRIAKFDINKFKGCLAKLFKVSFLSDKIDSGFVSNDSGGSFSGFFIPNGQTLPTIRTDSSTYTSLDLKIMGEDHNPDTITLGRTWSSHPELNYIGSDQSSLIKLVTQIHELGNSLWYFLSSQNLLQNQPQALIKSLRDWDGDAGMALEECVFEGKVRPNGQVTRKMPKR